MIFQNITKNEILNSTKMAFRVITIFVITFFTFVNWFLLICYNTSHGMKILSQSNHTAFLCIGLHFWAQWIFWSYFLKFLCSTQWFFVLCSSFENHTQLLSYRCDKCLPWTAPHRFPDLNKYSNLEFRNDSPLSL